MTTKTETRFVRAFGWSLALTSVLSALLVILKEKNAATMSLMKAATGHHWITHGITVLVVFVVLGLVLAKINSGEPATSKLNAVVIAIITSTVISGLILAGFNLPG